MPSHTLLTPTMIAREALRLLKNNLVMGQNVYRAYEVEFPGNPKIGTSVQIRKPVKFQVTKSRVRTSSAITEQYITLTCATQAHVSWEFNSVELTMTIEQYSERYIRPACAVLANTVDADLCALYDDIWNVVVESTGFVDPHTFMVMGKAMQRLDEEAAPPNDRCVVLNPGGHWAMANALVGLYGPASAQEQALRKGFLGRIAGADVYMDQNIKTHTVGKWATDSAAMSSASRFKVHTTADSASSGGLPTGAKVDVTDNKRIMLDGFNRGTAIAVLKTGDTFTIAGCYAVNPMSGESTGQLRSFVVTSDAYSITVSTIEDCVYVNFLPQMIHTGPYKTVDTIPQLEAAVQVFGVPNTNMPQNLAFQKNAFALVMVPLEVPQGVSFSSSVTEDGISIRLIKDYDITNDQEIIRLDILYGVSTIYPELAVRIAGGKTGTPA